MRLTTLMLAAAIAVPAVAMAQRQPLETETVDRNLTFPSGGTLLLKNFSGQVRITAGTGRNFVMKATRRGTAERLRDQRLIVDTVGSTIEVRENVRVDGRDRDRDWDRNDDGRNNVVQTEFEIQVPADAMLEVDVFSSDVTITGITGRQILKTFSGDINTTGSRGALRLNTFSGRIDADATGQGTSPEIDAETFSGEMRVRLAEGARGSVEFNTFSGSLDAGFPVTLQSGSRRNLRADLPGGGGRTLSFKSFSGSVRLSK